MRRRPADVASADRDCRGDRRVRRCRGQPRAAPVVPRHRHRRHRLRRVHRLLRRLPAGHVGRLPPSVVTAGWSGCERDVARSSRPILVVGNGMVGHRFVEAAVEHALNGIVVVGDETRRAYDRVHLSTVFDGARRRLVDARRRPMSRRRRRAAPRRSGRHPRPGEPAGGDRRRAGDPLRALRARHRLVPVRPSDPGQRTLRDASCTARSTTSTGSATGRPVAARRGRRRWVARARGRQRAAPARARRRSSSSPPG